MSPNTNIKTFTIDGKPVSAAEGETILEVARQNGINIPTLCSKTGLTPTAQCRLCMIEVAGSNRLFPSCATKPEEGMEITTDSPRILKYRQIILELLFSERNHTCAVCVTNGHCELQTMAQRLKVDHIRYEYLYPKLEVDGSHLKFEMDHNRCILCGRCVRVCDEIEGAHTLDLRNRGIQTLIITDFNRPWGESKSCTSCGKCVHVCPTGALAEKGKSVAEMTKRKHFLPYLVMRRKGASK